MHFHLPKTLQNWREMAKEIAIIVIGVLIALTAEQIVQAWQWRRTVGFAEGEMRGELLGDDGPQIYQRAAMHPCVQNRLDQIRDAVEGGKSRVEVGALVNSFRLNVRSYDSLGREQAVASQAAEHMPRKTQALFFKIYSVVPLLDRTNAQESIDLAQLHAFSRTGGLITAEERDRILGAVEALRNEDDIMWSKAEWMLPLLRNLGPLKRARTEQLMSDARKLFGPCVKPIPSELPANPQRHE